MVEVAPGTAANDAPALVLTIHWTVGNGFPLAAAVNVAAAGGANADTRGIRGDRVGAKSTVKVAAVVGACVARGIRKYRLILISITAPLLFR